MESQKSIQYQVIHTEKDIKEMTAILSEQVKEVAQSNDIFICLLNGGIFFYCDLLKQLSLQNMGGIEPSFLKAHTYDMDGKKVVVVNDCHLQDDWVERINGGTNIWIVDEIVDSGRTLTSVIDWFEKQFHIIDHVAMMDDERVMRKPEFNVVALMQRSSTVFDQRLKNHITGFTENHKEWFAGYGMDGTEGTLRAYPFIVIERWKDEDNEEED